jgi:ATP-dependent DNA helicase RecG
VLDYRALLLEWRALPAETEWLDFKSAHLSFSVEKLGCYVSALANEANLMKQDAGWMVFGVGDQRDASTGLRPVVGSAFVSSPAECNEVKRLIALGTSPPVSLTDPVALSQPECAANTRVLMWRIPPAPRGAPVAWKGHFYGRDGESLGALALHELETIRAQSSQQDWSAQQVDADWGQLDANALMRARHLYDRRHAGHAQVREAAAHWDDQQFVHQLRLAVDGKLTRAALVLLGAPTAVAWLSGPTPRLTWVLSDHQGNPESHQHFELPLLLAIDGLVDRIRVYEVALLPPGQLAPLNLPNYDAWVLREALYNCVAHQDYAQGGRIRVTETPGTLTFFNLGTFLPGSIDRVLAGRQPEQRYRNACLANAMVELDLIETLNSGVPKMFRKQRERYFPMPDFELGSDPDSVSVRIHGKVLDLNYVRTLMQRSNLSLEVAILLDRVQKGIAIDAAAAKELRAQGLVEGRLSRLTVSSLVAGWSGAEVEYVRTSGLDDAHFHALICKLLMTGPQPRRKIDALLVDKLPDSLKGTVARRARVRQLLQTLRDRGDIVNVGKATRGAIWALAKSK